METLPLGSNNWISVRLFKDSDSILTPELFSPDTEKWTRMAPHFVPRNYHSIGLLLKSGQVLAGGGGLCGNCNVNHADFEIFSPPYLFNRDGSLATRPRILRVPTSFRPGGGQLRVWMDTADDHTFALIRLSAVTHTVNNDLRRIPLQVRSVNRRQRRFRLKIPGNPAILPPGNYFLFAMNSQGVPSVAETIRCEKKVDFVPISR